MGNTVIQPKYNSDTLDVALITVCVDPDTVEQISHATAQMPWAIIGENFDGYMSAGRRPHLPQPVLSARACLAIVDFDQDHEHALETTAYLHQQFFGRIAIVALSASEDPDLLLRAMRGGCSEYLKLPIDEVQFSETLARLDQWWSNTVGRPAVSGKVLSFFGAKGGVGSTTIAVHLANFLVRACKKKVLLIDNHAQLGHVCLYLGMDGTRYPFHELTRNVSRLDHELLRGYIATHSSGLDVLSSPDSHGGVRNIDPAAMEQTLDFLRREYEYVVLDCEASFEDTNLSVIEVSDQVYLVATPEIGAIRDLSRYVDGLVQSAQTTDKLRIVINRYSAREAVSIEQIEKAIRLPVAIKINNDYSEVVRAINVGEPVAPDRKSDFSSQMMKWCVALTGAIEAPALPPRKKVLGLW